MSDLELSNIRINLRMPSYIYLARDKQSIAFRLIWQLNRHNMHLKLEPQCGATAPY